MSAQPEPMEVERATRTSRPCPDCGGPMEADAEEWFRICRPCYDAYVDNAGR
jgi:hypothetical protein